MDGLRSGRHQRTGARGRFTIRATQIVLDLAIRSNHVRDIVMWGWLPPTPHRVSVVGQSTQNVGERVRDWLHGPRDRVNRTHSCRERAHEVVRGHRPARGVSTLGRCLLSEHGEAGAQVFDRSRKRALVGDPRTVRELKVDYRPSLTMLIGPGRRKPSGNRGHSCGPSRARDGQVQCGALRQRPDPDLRHGAMRKRRRY